PPVAALRPVLADPDLVAPHVTDDPCGHEAGLRPQVGLAVAAEKEHVRRERLPLVGAEPVDEQPLPFVDAVLLAADGDDRVAVHVTKSGPRRPASRASVATSSLSRLRPATPTSARTPTRRCSKARPPRPRPRRPASSSCGR